MRQGDVVNKLHFTIEGCPLILKTLGSDNGNQVFLWAEILKGPMRRGKHHEERRTSIQKGSKVWFRAPKIKIFWLQRN